MIDAAWKSWYRAQHEKLCLASGDNFERYVTEILKRFHSDYLNPAPMGRHGDGGCDGIAGGGKILYACYGQRAVTGIDQKTKDKLESDFARGISNWEDFSTWRFITNAQVGTLATKSILSLRKKHAVGTERPIDIEIWQPDDLWLKAVSQLNPTQLDEIIPGVPHAKDVKLADLVELINSLESIVSDGAANNQPIRPVPATKMDYNKLHPITRAEFDEGRLLSARIQQWFSEQANPELRDEKASRFRIIYEESRKATNDVREIIHRIYVALGGEDFRSSTDRANAVYAVTAYFFDSCDIFEDPQQS